MASRGPYGDYVINDADFSYQEINMTIQRFWFKKGKRQATTDASSLNYFHLCTCYAGGYMSWWLTSKRTY